MSFSSGRLTRDPELRALPSGTSVCTLRVACSSSRKDAGGEYREKPNYFDVSVYGGAAEGVSRYTRKGSRVAIDGRLEWSEWESSDRQKRQAVSIVADTVQFLDSPGGQRREPGADGGLDADRGSAGEYDEYDDEDGSTASSPASARARRTRSSSSEAAVDGRIDSEGCAIPRPSLFGRQGLFVFIIWRQIARLFLSSRPLSAPSRRSPSAGSGAVRGAPGATLARRGRRGPAVINSPRREPSGASQVPVNTQAIGKQYEPTTYAVGREKIKEYARAVGETNPVHLDEQAARDAGYADVVAPPMFAVVYSAPSIGPPIFDPEIELNFALMVHGGQEFQWGPLVVAGDEITTTTSVKDISEQDGRGYYVFESVSTNQRGEQVCRGTWTNIVRGV